MPRPTSCFGPPAPRCGSGRSSRRRRSSASHKGSPSHRPSRTGHLPLSRAPAANWAHAQAGGARAAIHLHPPAPRRPQGGRSPACLRFARAAADRASRAFCQLCVGPAYCHPTASARRTSSAAARTPQQLAASEEGASGGMVEIAGVGALAPLRLPACPTRCSMCMPPPGRDLCCAHGGPRRPRRVDCPHSRAGRARREEARSARAGARGGMRRLRRRRTFRRAASGGAQRDRRAS